MKHYILKSELTLENSLKINKQNVKLKYIKMNKVSPY